MAIARSLLISAVLGSCAATGWALGCASASNGASEGQDPGTTSGPATTAGPASGTAACAPCILDSECAQGEACTQFASDNYCAPLCDGAGGCTAGRSCTQATTTSGAEVDVCLPNDDACGPTPTLRRKDAGAVDAGGLCSGLAPPTTAATCHSCGTHPCQANGCYGGYYCNLATSKCQAPPSTCGGGGPSNDAGPPPPPPPPPPPAPDAGPSSIGPNGGTEAKLFFAVLGDTRPATVDDTAAYPTAVISKIFEDITAFSPMPPFVISTGDYQFSSTKSGQAAPQMDLYQKARAPYPGVQFPAMGNHECTGATASNCGSSGSGMTEEYSAFLEKFLAPIQKTLPYYVIHVNATDGSWTSKFVVIAANAWDSTQATWLDTAMAEPTTYTFVVRHEPAAATTAPGTKPSEAIIAKHPYTLAIVGHTHTYGKTGAKQITIGNGGAPLTGGATYGYGIIAQRPDGALTIDMYDYQSNQPDTAFHFAVKADGSVVP